MQLTVWPVREQRVLSVSVFSGLRHEVSGGSWSVSAAKRGSSVLDSEEHLGHGWTSVHQTHALLQHWLEYRYPHILLDNLQRALINTLMRVATTHHYSAAPWEVVVLESRSKFPNHYNEEIGKLDFCESSDSPDLKFNDTETKQTWGPGVTEVHRSKWLDQDLIKVVLCWWGQNIWNITTAIYTCVNQHLLTVGLPQIMKL